ncbi:hypothetical protein QTP88_021192 [Uroleucon formosanum]
MADMELTVEDAGSLEEARVGDGVAVVLTEDAAPKQQKRRRVEAPETEGIVECAVIRVSTFPERVRSIGRDLDGILAVEKEKKKLSAAVHRSIIEVRERYEVLLDEALRQNTILQGRLEEARSERMSAREEIGEVRMAEVSAMRVVEVPAKGKGKGKNKTKKVVEEKGCEKKATKATGPKKGTFVEVVSKKARKRRNKKKRAEESLVAATATAKAAKAVEREKARAPARSFVVSVGEAGTSEARKELWADLVKRVAVPKIGGAARLPRGDLVVRPADEATFEALKRLEKEGKGVREESARWPTVMVYDVERGIKKEELLGRIMDQNPELGLDKEAVVPLFMKGPKTGELVWWVCSVRPSIFKALVGKSLFIGLSRCKVKEYVDVVRCFKCQRFGHRALKCVQTVDTCGRCAVKGHRTNDCKSASVKCANCGLAAQSVQLNMNGNHLVSDQILDYSRANGVEVLLLQEVPTSGNRLVGFDYGAVKTVLSCRDGSAGAAIVVLNQDIEVVDLQGLSDRYCAVASLRKGRGQAVVFVSAYFKYSIQTRIFTDRLGDILDRVNNDVVIGADVNAHSPQWFSRPGNNSGSARGTHVESLIAAKHLTVHNQPGRLDTYERPGMGSSNIDVTLTRGGSLTHSVSEWEVLDVTDSDHRTIRFKIQVGSGLDGPSVGKSRFNVRKADWDRFRWVLAQKVYGDPETMAGGCGQAAESLTRALGLAMEASMPRSRKSVRIKPPWWDAGLEESKRRLNNFRRTKDYKVSDRDQFRVLRNEHLKKIRKAKMESWRKFATSINSDIWGPVYRWARNGSAKSRVPNAVLRENGTFTVTALETAECLLESLIPRDRTAPVFADECVGRVRPEVTEAEVKRAVWRMAPNKAPGLDGITAGVLRKAWGVIGTPLTSVLAECLRKSEFPDCWKTAEVVVIKKGEDRDPGLPKSYRPVSLLSVPSKVLERLVVDRLEEETGGALSAEQHGFRVGKSTISAIKSCPDWVDNSEEDMVVGIFLDISGAFDNLRWNILIRDMVDLGASDATRSIIQSYLTGRRAVLSVEGATAFADLTRGCPQGSQLGPSLWNLSMDRALVTNNDDRVKLVAYADDLAVLIAGSDLGEIQGKARATLGALRDWATLRGLTFSASKSQAISLKGGLRPGFTVPFGTDEIVAVGSVRYLGVELDSRRNFWAHVCGVAGKSDTLYSRLRAASSADWGLRQSTSAVIYRAVFLPRITYAAEIWSKGVLTARARKLLGSKQRRALLSLTGAYRTTSTDALQVVAGQLPLDLEIRWHVVRINRKAGLISEEQMTSQWDRILDVWQDRWDSSDKGRWTYSLLPDIRRRLDLPLEVDHYVCQFLTGHGDFNAKLESFALRGSGMCRCETEDETVDHVLYRCPLLSDERARVIRLIGEDVWPCPTKVFLDIRSNYCALRRFARVAIEAKRISDRVGL